MSIELLPVTSSNIEAIGHDPVSDVLHVQFKNGRYTYAGVSADQHKALISAKSVGAHLAQHIKPKHEAKKL